MVNSIECVGKLGTSDHVLIFAEFNISSDIVEQSQEVLDWKRANMNGIRSNLNINW